MAHYLVIENGGSIGDWQLVGLRQAESPESAVAGLGMSDRDGLVVFPVREGPDGNLVGYEVPEETGNQDGVVIERKEINGSRVAGEE